MTKSIRASICPKCGKPSEEHELCTECRIGGTPWFTCDKRVTSIHCPSCEATKQVNTWTDTGKSRYEIGPELAKTAVHFHPDVKKPFIDVHVVDMTVNRSRADLIIKGMLYKHEVEGKCSVEIIWHKEQCDRCNRISGSYYEGIVQVRADRRLPSNYEVSMAESIAQGIEDSLQSGGERLSFVSEIGATKDGIDITVGSQHIGAKISQAITAQLGGRYTTHPKLVGEKNGRQLFRITYSVRLPRFRKDDVVKSGKKYIRVERVESNYVRGTDLHDGTDKSVREDDVDKLIGNAQNAESALIVYGDGKTMGVMDPVTMKTVELRHLRWLKVEAGEYLKLMRDGDTLIMLG